MDPNERRKKDGSNSNNGQSSSKKGKETNGNFRGMVRGVASGTSVTNTNQSQKEKRGENSQAPTRKTMSTIRQGDEKPTKTSYSTKSLNLQLSQLEYLEQYKKYVYAKTMLDKDIIRYPAVKFEMGKFKPVFGKSLLPFVEQYVDTDEKDRRADDHAYCHAKTDFSMHHFSLKPRRNSETQVPHVANHSFHNTRRITSKLSLHSNASRTSRQSRFYVSGSQLDVNKEDLAVKNQKHSKHDYLDLMRTGRIESEEQKQLCEEKAKNEEKEKARLAVGANEDQLDENKKSSTKEKKANVDKKLKKQYSNYSIRCINLEMMALQNRQSEDDDNYNNDYDFRDLAKQKGSSLSYEDILNIDLKAAKMAKEGDIAGAPEITWREYKMMSQVLKMASFENRGLAQMLATDEKAQKRWKRMKELFEANGKEYYDDKKKKLFVEDGILLGKSVSQTSVFSASKMSVTDYAARLSGEMSIESEIDGPNQVKKSASQLSIHPQRQMTVGRATFASSVPVEASRSDISLHTIASDDGSLYSLRAEKSLHSAASGNSLQPTHSEVSLRSAGAAPYYGLREKYDPQNKSETYDAIHREKKTDGDRTCYPEGTDQSWEWRKAKHQEMLRKREAERRRQEFLERRKKAFLSMTPEEIARLMCMMGGNILPGMEDILEDEEEFVYDDGVWGGDDENAVYDNYTEKPEKFGLPGLDYVVQAEDEWVVTNFIKEGKEGVGTYRTHDRHRPCGKGKPFKVEEPVEISDWNLKLKLQLEKPDRCAITSVPKDTITRDRPPNPPWRFGPEKKVIDDFDDSNLDEDLRRKLRKPVVTLPFVPLVNKAKKEKEDGKSKSKAASPAGKKPIKLPPAPRQPPAYEWQYDNQKEDEKSTTTMKGRPVIIPGNEEHTREMKEMEQKIRNYERRQQEKKAKQPWLEGPVGFSKQVCRFGLPMEMRELEGMTPEEYLKKYCYLSARRARHYLAGFEKVIDERKPMKFTAAPTVAGSAASLKPGQSVTSSDPAKSLVSIPSVVHLTNADLQKTISREEIFQGIQNVHYGNVKVQQVEELLELIKLTDVDIRIESPLFMAICALTERLYFNKFAHVSDHRVVSGMEAAEKLVIEKTDFGNLKFLVDGIRVSKDMEQLFEVLQASDTVAAT